MQIGMQGNLNRPYQEGELMRKRSDGDNNYSTNKGSIPFMVTGTQNVRQKMSCGHLYACTVCP